MNVCRYSGFEFARCPMICRIFSAYGLLWRMRSCVRRILLAATICMALVIFCVLLTLRIFCRTSLPAAISGDSSLERLRRFEFLDRSTHRCDDVVVECASLRDFG